MQTKLNAEDRRAVKQADLYAKRKALAEVERAKKARADATRNDIDTIIEDEMSHRGFVKHTDKPGHWRSASGYGHDLEFRHRRLVQWLCAAYITGGKDAAMAKLRGEVDAAIHRQVQP